MKLEDQVCILKLAKKLKGLGVKQKSEFYWCDNCGIWGLFNKDYYHLGSDSPVIKAIKGGYFEHHYSAFTVAELGEMLPCIWGELLLGNDGNCLIRIYKNMGDDKLVNWTIIYDTQGRTPFVRRGEKVDKGFLHQEDGEKFVNALARMVIYLKENVKQKN